MVAPVLITAVALSATISNLYVTGLTTGQGYAAMFRPYAGSTVTGAPEFTNYSAPAGLGTAGGNGASGSIARLTGYSVVLPVNQTSQYQTLQLEVLANEHGTSTLNHIAFDNGDEAVNLTYDMVAGAWLNESFSSTKVNGTNGSLSLQFKEVAIGGKATTYLWLPTDNGTTNGLPAGLERYVGEQSFDLVALNSSSTWTSVSIPYPWGGNYTVTVHPGLNNLLLPRAQFLNSSFAAAVLQGKEVPYPSTHPTPPILAQDTTAQGILTSAFGSSSGLMFDLEAYWQNRAIALGSTGNFTSAENGTSSTSYLQVRVVSVASAESNNTGGLAADPAVYTTSDPAPPALQAIVTLNVTSSATLDLLLAGLLDNTTGAWDGVNGTLASVTSQVASLGFDAPVLSALANAPIVSEGLYGTPPYKPSSHPSGGLWGEFWNAVSAVVTTPAGAILALVGEVWTLTLAVTTFLDHLAIEAAKIDGKLLSMSAAVLVATGRVICQGLQDLLDVVWGLIQRTVSAVVQPLSAVFSGALKAWASSLFAATNWTLSAYNGTQNAETRAVAQLGSVLVAPLLVATSIGVVVDIVLGIAAPLDIGASAVVGFLAPLVIDLFKASLSYGSPAGWSALLSSQLNPSTLSSWSAFDSLSQWLFNHTQSINSTTADAWIHPPGDYWALLAGVAGAGAFISSFVAVYAAQAKNPKSDATGLSATAMIFGLASLVFVVAEYLVSTVSSSYVAHVAEFGLAVLAAEFGLLAIGSGAFAIVFGNGLDAAAFAGGAGVGLGAFGLWASYHDVDSLYAEG